MTMQATGSPGPGQAGRSITATTAATSSQSLTVPQKQSSMNMTMQGTLRQRAISRRAETLQGALNTRMMPITAIHPYVVQAVCSRTIMMRKAFVMQSQKTAARRISYTGTACCQVNWMQTGTRSGDMSMVMNISARTMVHHSVII